MVSKPWFRKHKLGAGWVPATPQGYIVLVVWIAAVLGTFWLPSGYREPALIGLGLAYLAGSFWLAQPR